jgi:hypothetical protein
LSDFDLEEKACLIIAYKKPIGAVVITNSNATQKSKKLIKKLCGSLFFIKIFFRKFSKCTFLLIECYQALALSVLESFLAKRLKHLIKSKILIWN